MRCVILAAGYATRLYPLTENQPKPLLKVGDTTILDRLVDDVGDAAERFVVVSNHKFIRHFERWAEGRGNVTVLDDGTLTNETRLGAVRDIALALDALNEDDDALVMAGDNLLTFSLRPFIDYARQKGASCVMCHRETRLEALRKTAVIDVDGDGRIVSYEEKPSQPKGELAVPPFYYYRSRDIRRVGEALSDGCGADAPGSFAAWLSKRAPMYAWEMPGPRYDIGDLASYRAAAERFGSGEPGQL